MTEPLGRGSLGDAYINVHARTDDVEPDLRKGLEKAGKDANSEADKVGKDVGDHIGSGVEKEVVKHGPAIAHSIGRSVEKEVVTVRPNFRWSLRGKDGRFISRTAANIREEVEEAFSDTAAGAGNIFSKIGQAIGDAIGAGFNVSGKSPLVYILAPVYAALAGLVVAAIQAANGVIAAILAIPAALAVLGVEIGVLYLAFHGLGEAIQGAFAATNAEELDKALSNLTPHAQSFVRALLPARTLFQQLSKLAQESFFTAFGGGERITALLNALKKPLTQGIPVVAAALGDFFAKLTMFFESPLFGQFLGKIFPAVAQIIQMLSGPFINLLVSLFILINNSLPFLIGLTSRFGDLLRNIGDLLAGVNPQWLDDMLTTLDKTFDLVGQVIALVAVLFAQVNAAGGNDMLDFLTEAVGVLKNFFASDIGKEAIAGLIRTGEIGIFIVVALIEAVALLLAGFQLLTNTIGTFVHWLLFDAWPAVQKFFSNFGDAIGLFFTSARDMLSTAMGFISTFISTGLSNLVEGLRTRITDAVDLLKSLPQRAQDAVGSLGNILKNAGRSLIQGLIDGVNQMISPLKNALGYITGLIPDFKGPEDKDRKLLVPAGRAVMEGFTDGLRLGSEDMKTMLGDFTSGLGVGVSSNSTSYLFGAGAVAVNFKGALPTQDQAMATGVAVGQGINSQIAARNTRLAVRTL